MKIDDRSQPIPLNAYKTLANKHKGLNQGFKQAVQNGSRDKVELSQYSRTVQQAAETLKGLPEIRQDLVDQVKAAVDTGNYQVDPEKTAAAILKESFENESVMRRIDLIA